MTCLILLFILACTSISETTSTVPISHEVDGRPKFDILGEILLESSERVGYVGLLKAARNLYPDCDYLIDIMIDQRITTKTETTSYFPLNLIFFYLKNNQSVSTEVTWIMRGTAIKYKQ